MWPDTRVLIVEDHALLAETLAASLRSVGYDARILAPGDAADQGELLSSAQTLEPDVVLLDLELGRHHGEGLIRPLARTGAEVVVVTGSLDRSRWGGCLHLGARCVLAKNHSLAELVELVNRVRAGLPVLRDAEYHELVGLWRLTRAEDDGHRHRLAALTPREQEVLDELMAGHTIRDIAHRAVVAEGTVRKQVCSVLSKLEVSTQIGAVGLAHRVGWRRADTLVAR